MVSVSHEDDHQTEARLRRVLVESRVDRLPGAYAFREFAPSTLGDPINAEALALVRDGDRWSRLALAAVGDAEPFAVFAVHFPAEVDNSGFVGWLATRLKGRLGTGVVVVCGLNTADGGIYDYWGAPLRLADDVAAEFAALKAGEQT